MTASVLQQLLALYFAIIHSWQLSRREKTLLEKKIHQLSQIFFCFLFLFFVVVVVVVAVLTNMCLPCRLR